MARRHQFSPQHRPRERARRARGVVRVRWRGRARQPPVILQRTARSSAHGGRVVRGRGDECVRGDCTATDARSRVGAGRAAEGEAATKAEEARGVARARRREHVRRRRIRRGGG